MEFEPIGPWTDITSEFVSGSATIAGTGVGAVFKQASAGQQAPGLYLVRVEVVTNTTRRLVDSWLLEVTGEALP